MKRRRLIIALVLSIAAAAVADESDQVLVAYEVPYGGGRISGVARSMEWSATQLGDGAAVHARVPVRSFDSGHPKFDSLVREALQADRHPFVEIDGMIRRGRFEGTLTLRGASCPLAMPVTIVRAGRQIVLETSFGFNLTQFGVALPGVGSRVIVDFVARISAGPHAVEAGGALSSN